MVGDDLAQTLYRRTNITGRQIRLKVNGTDRYFTVCGVVRAQTGAFGGMLSAVAPHLVYVPYACIASRKTERTDQVFVQCISQTDTASVSSQIEKYLTDRQQVRGVHVQNMSGAVQTVQQLAEMGIGLFAAVGTVTLFVALIGAMGSMLAAAHEKTGEIGILLALGAQPHDIRRTFLLQAVLLPPVRRNRRSGSRRCAPALRSSTVPAGRPCVCRIADTFHTSAEPLPDCSRRFVRPLSIQSTQYANNSFFRLYLCLSLTVTNNE